MPPLTSRSRPGRTAALRLLVGLDRNPEETYAFSEALMRIITLAGQMELAERAAQGS